MVGDAEQIAAGLAGLVTELAGLLSPDGWHRRDFMPLSLGVFTRPVGDGFLAVADLERVAHNLLGPEHWPVELRVSFGCGYELATALMPLLTLDPNAVLVSEALTGDGAPAGTTLVGSGDVPAAAARLAGVIRDHGVEFAQGLASVAAAEAALADREVTALSWEVTRRPLLLAAAGHGDRAVALVEEYVHAHAAGTTTPEYARFARQLRRRVDAGQPAPPPVEETLRGLPPRSGRPPRPSLKAARSSAQGKKDAVDAVRQLAKGQTRAQFTALLTESFAERGIDAAPSVIAAHAQALELQQQPFGGVLRTLHGLRLLKDLGQNTADRVRDRTGPEPAWLRPPENASYPLRGYGRRWIAVHLAPEAAGLLARAAVEASRPLGPLVAVDVWLTGPEPGADDTTPVAVHLGEHIVGTLATADSAALAPYFAAAHRFDEHIRVRGHITAPRDGQAAALEIALPD